MYAGLFIGAVVFLLYVMFLRKISSTCIWPQRRQ